MLKNRNFDTYLLPTAMDVHSLRAIPLEESAAENPLGVHGVGEASTALVAPAADLISALTAADSKAVIQSRQGVRRAALPDLIQGPGRCALEPGELILGFVLPPFRRSTHWSFDKIDRRNALAIARMIGAAIWKEDGGKMRNVRLCIGAATQRPTRFCQAEMLLEDNAPIKRSSVKRARRSLRQFWKRPVCGSPAAISCRRRWSLRHVCWKMLQGGNKHEIGVHTK